MFSPVSNRFNITGSSNIRASMSNRISRLFTRKEQNDSTLEDSRRTSSACEVPIFMSPPADQPGSYQPNYHLAVADDRRFTIPASSVYSESPGQQHRMQFLDGVDDHQAPSIVATDYDLEQGNSSVSAVSSETRLLRDKRQRRRRVTESTRSKIASKRRLSMAFGITTLAAVITYLVLAVTRIAQGLMFHILSILFILVLAGLFLHSSIRLIMLQKRRRARMARHRNWHGVGRTTTSSSSQSESEVTTDPFADPTSEKPIQISMGAEEIITTTPRGKNKKVIKQPPPVYGNMRESKRMNPEMVFWHKQNPSPTTPTYEEAIKDVQTVIGFQPPQYVSPKRERQALGGERASNVHPLERERLVGLMGNTMSSRRP